MSRRRISPVDHAWLRMDSPVNWMIITGLMTFDTPLDFERYKDIVQRSLLCFRRFRQRLVWPVVPIRRPYWEDDPDFDLDYHIERVTLPAPAGQSALQDLISELMGQGLDYDRPLWRFYVVENYGEGGALVTRIHHCLADGVALVRVLLSMADTTPDGPQPDYQPSEPAGLEPEPGWLENTLDLLPLELQQAVRAARGLARTGLKALSDPDYAIDLTRFGVRTAEAVGRLVLRWPDPQTLFKGQLGVEKRATWSEPLRLDEVKSVGRAYGATVNDVLLSAVAGALRCYLQHRQETVEGISIRGIVPVNLRPQDTAGDLGNKFGLVFLSLPIGIADPIQRLRALKCCMDGIKSTPEALASYGILGVLGAVPPWLQDVAVSIFDAKGSAVMTNVPGPKQPLYLAGAPINTVMAWVPQSGRMSLGVSLISYHGKVWLGIATDKEQVPDPERIVVEFSREFEGMRHCAEQLMARRRKPFVSMLSMLDEVLETLDEVMAKPQPLDEPSPAAIPCQGQTRSGLPCKNPPLAGQAFCRVHQKRAGETA